MHRNGTSLENIVQILTTQGLQIVRSSFTQMRFVLFRLQSRQKKVKKIEKSVIKHNLGVQIKKKFNDNRE